MLQVTPPMRRQVPFLRKVLPARQTLEGGISPAQPLLRAFGGLLLALPGPRRTGEATPAPQGFPGGLAGKGGSGLGRLPLGLDPQPPLR